MKQQGKLACWLLCFALCFCMVLALVPATEAAAACAHVDETVKDGRCDICQELMAPVQLIQTSASLEGNICVNYFMLLSDEVANDKDAYIQFTMADGEEIQTSVRDSKLIDGYDVFTCEVDAKEMTDIITMQFFYGNGQPALAEAHPYNVRAYAQHVMKHYTDEKTQDLMTAMVNYGAASQIHFDYHTDDLANYDKDGNLMVTVPDYENVHITEFGFTPGQGTQNVKLYSASLLLNSETTLRLFFNGKISATHNGKNLDVKQRSGLYYVDIVGIAARELDDDVTITINDGTESANIVFSPMSYCQIVEQDTSGAYDTEMKNLVRALYLYNKAADEYFGDAVIGPQGTNMVNALHYLNGDKNNTKITEQVNSVTFGRSRDYRNIVRENTGILMDVEQDTPAYVYYILNGEKYDLYFLSNDAIYAPANVAGLFKGMTNLTAVETGNFNVSRAENMNQWFRKCGALKSVSGIEKWDTSAVTNMSSMFRECGVSGNLNLTGWNVSNVTTMKTMFYRCPNAFSLNAKGWDTGNVTDMSYMFTECSKLLSVNAAGWDTSEVTTMYVMFAQCGSLTTLNATGWNTSKVTDVRLMFQGDRSLATVDGSGGWNLASVTKAECMFDTCSSLTELDVASWNLSKADTLWNMFVKCTNLTTLNGEENWKLSSATTTNFMFQDCYKLQELSVRNWDMSSVTSMEAMFFACYNLRELDVTDWDVSKVTNFRYWIGSANQNEGDMKLEKIIGTENWRPVSAVNIGSMFYGCGQLTELNLSGWDMPNMTNANHMFADCYKLKSINLSGWNTPSVFSIDCMFNHCKALSTIDLSSFTTNNVLEFSQLFEGCESLTEITGLKNFNTAKGASFSEMFSGCKSLKVLDLSSFDTRGANESYKYHYTHVTDYSEGFENMFANMTSLEKLVLGENFSFDGDGKVTTAGYKCVLPNPAPIDGQATKWYNAETDTYYDASEIPQHTDKAVTYVAAVPPANP